MLECTFDMDFNDDQEAEMRCGEKTGSQQSPLTQAVDRELEAAIEYKIATYGVDGVELILDLVHVAVRRRLREAA